MRISELFGLPAHPLLVHLPVVLLPLVAAGAIWMAFSASARERVGWVVLGLSIVAGISTQLAIGSGKALEDAVKGSPALRTHETIAESIRPLALLLFLVALAIMLLDRRALGRWPFKGQPGKAVPKAGAYALAAVMVVVSLGTVARLYQIGDSGAKATWQNTHITNARDGG